MQKAHCIVLIMQDNSVLLMNSIRVANTLKSYLMRSDTELPARQDVEQASETILQLHEANGGATFSLYFGDQAGQRLYSVSVFPDRSYAQSDLLGRRYNQEGVFDLFRMEYIPTGGSGEDLERLPPVLERLPVLQRGRRRDNDRDNRKDAR